MIVSLVIPAFNEAGGLAATLASIHRAMDAFHAAGWRTELIVCDNNSSDATAAVARAAGATVVFEPINQIARARNTGARHAGGDWLVFVDADSHPSRELFEDVVQAIRHGRCLAGGSTVTYLQAPLAVRVAALTWNATSRMLRWGAGSFIFCEAAAFREVGGFSQQLFAAEEIDLFRRLKLLARRARRTIVILHRHPLRTSDRKYHLYSGREVALFMLKTIIGRGRTLRTARDCFAWYDGRR